MKPPQVPSLETLDRLAAPGALFVAEVDRPADEFHFQVRRAGGDRAVPTRDDLLGLVPPGSRWTDALGWSAYFGWPLEAGGWNFWALGAEEVHRRSSGPGAYPAVRVYLHGAPPVAAIEALAADLDGGAGRPDPPPPGVTVVPMSGATTAACRADQAAILRQAAAACAAGGTPLFRTAVLTEDEAFPLAGLPARLPRGVDRALLGVPEALARTYSPKARALLYLRAFWRPR